MSFPSFCFFLLLFRSFTLHFLPSSPFHFVVCFLVFFCFQFFVCSFCSLQFSPLMLTTSRGRFVFFVGSAFHSDSGFNPPLPPHASVSNLISVAVSCMTQPQLTGGTAATHSYITQLEWALYDTGSCNCWCNTAVVSPVRHRQL